MADYVIAEADVKTIQVGNVKPLIARYNAGGTIVAGKTVALDSVTGTAVPADATVAEENAVIGVAVNDALVGQYIDVIQAGYVELGAVGTAGDVAVLSQTAGGLAPNVDLVATNEVAVVGYFTDASTLLVDINNLGIVRG